ncbi:sugar phosphate isomerase/epimerase family protein [Falsochrobactrum ovis]|uniref:D-psicose/D-tagatose/L-ribulose 3-epimerase n=1 Tax=Falsochrobactrum ovis TaxID=1293442 RepID=A0A364JU86_9HYPH|nr:sugar phosphate isomerase/epimerase [Falsochrobactrum ovis]RAK27827.1 D-psicose/D-tagatose/L-ribulose 3-epimerase [Falsochrobactrum ovis]
MRNRLGLHANVWVAGWSDEEAIRAIDKTAEKGFDLIEISAMAPHLMNIDLTRRRLEQAGIGVTMSLGLAAEQDISSTDPQRVRAGEAHLMDVVSMARDLGATHVCGILYSAFQKYTEPATAAGVASSIEVMARIAEKAAASDITLGMEVVNRYESNVLNTAAQAIEYCRRVGADNVKVHLDVYHMNIEEADAVAAIHATGDRLGYFHTGESHRGYMGTGSIDLKAIFQALARIDYKGPITYESFSSRVVGQPLSGILGIWRETWDDGDDLVQHAMMYTKSQMIAAHNAVSRSSSLP